MDEALVKRAKWAWLALTGIGLAMRLISLGMHPLGYDEALTALPAWEAATNTSWPETSGSPFLLVGNALLFATMSTHNAIARLIPALAGAGLLLLPWLWRRLLGDRGALVAAFLLALSPLGLFASRHLDSAILGALGGALLVTTLFTHTLLPLNLSLAVASAGLVLGLTGGAVFYDVMLPGLLAWGAFKWMTRELPKFAPSFWLHVLAWGGGIAFLISTAAGFRWQGWSGPFEGLTSWIHGWTVAGSLPCNPALLLLYEPASVLLAVVGLGIALKRGQPFPVSLALWSLIACMLGLIRVGAGPTTLLAAQIPITVLAGWAAYSLIATTDGGLKTLPETPRWIREWGLPVEIAVHFVLWVFIVVVLIRQTAYLGNGLEIPLALLVCVIQGLIFGALGTLAGVQKSARALLAGTVIFLALIQVAFGSDLAYGPAANAAEPVIADAPTLDLNNLHRAVEDRRVASGKGPDTFEITLVQGDPAVTATLAWVLRDFSRLTIAESWPISPPDVVIAHEDDVPVTNGNLQGAGFVVSERTGGPVPGCSDYLPPVCKDWFAWYFYRRTPISLEQTRVILWAAPSFQE